MKHRWKLEKFKNSANEIYGFEIYAEDPDKDGAPFSVFAWRYPIKHGDCEWMGDFTSLIEAKNCAKNFPRFLGLKPLKDPP